ncbi:MAG: SUF system NifU family Fe-S cluster assembly protein [Rhodocyclaceae bacterium]|jgi:nitrogen fixation NifU-like protein|nr:SUF system NifU family Fe-S cluster assembly protein [Rhodocyclaceae bacterium]MCE2978945.1 SUF system NifU family Fe-S cluster assembly protein [Betaproteobacteria bacterium]MCA3073019.1 SUF system NifU family Fe-S cluster assembly protein [Rhodocyclaceae bacterium]MCA3088705.1 SUF system NifU family Fe-S cluster assembly protein [Rhodocyclaceae bacterium]MCA3092511.1 SUF system NifU family Fe-S cluster assembly protein [Rhodocyclaceae bacterium]
MSASNQLYQEVILDHNRKPRNWGTVPDANLRAEGHNPLCGDHIVLTLSVGAARTVDAVGFEGDGCAICKASASMMTVAVKGRPVGEAEAMVQQFRDMATGKLDPERDENLLGRLKVFSGVKDLPSRVKCAILPWHTLHAALNNDAVTSTEGDAA